MDIKVILYTVVVLIGLIFGDTNSFNKRKWYVVIIISMLILESCLRSITVGVDTRGYFYDYEEMKYFSWQNIWSSFSNAYLLGEGRDPGFLVYMKLIQSISYNFNVFLFFSALIFFIPLGIILFRYSTHIYQLLFAFTLYVALFNIVALSGIRQQVAMGFSFMSFLLLCKRKYVKSALMILIGSFIHISLLLFLIVIIIKLLFEKYLKNIHLLSFATIPLGFLWAGPIMLFFASFLSNDYYSLYGTKESAGGAILYIVLVELLSLFCYISIKKQSIVGYGNIKFLYPMLPLLTMTAPLTSLDGSMIRIGQYFTFYLMLLVPYAIDEIINVKIDRRLLYYSSVAFLISIDYISNNGFTYHFYWQEAQI